MHPYTLLLWVDMSRGTAERRRPPEETYIYREITIVFTKLEPVRYVAVLKAAVVTTTTASKGIANPI